MVYLGVNSSFKQKQAGAELCQAQAPIASPAESELIKKEMLQSKLC